MMKVFSTEFEKYYHLNPESFLLSLVSVFYYVRGAYFLLGSENISYSALEVFFPKLLKFFLLSHGSTYFHQILGVYPTKPWKNFLVSNWSKSYLDLGVNCFPLSPWVYFLLNSMSISD